MPDYSVGERGGGTERQANGLSTESIGSSVVTAPLRVLVVEDCRSWTNAISRELTKDNGYEFYSARSFEEVEVLLKTGWKPDVVILDGRLGDDNYKEGGESAKVYSLLSSLNEGPPIIYRLTAGDANSIPEGLKGKGVFFKDEWDDIEKLFNCLKEHLMKTAG